MANRVTFELTAKQEQAVRGMLDLVKAQDKATAAHGRATGGADRYEKKMRSVTSTLGRMFTGVVALAGTYGLVRLSKNALESADNIAKTADKIGITTDALQELRGAGKLTGIEIEKMDLALAMLGRNLGEFSKTGAGAAKPIIEGLSRGFQEMVAAGKPVDELLEQLGDEFQTLGNRNEQLAAAQKLAGKSGTVLLNLLDKQSAGIRTMRREMQAAGTVMKEEYLRSAEQLNDTMGVLTDSTMVKLNSAIISLAPTLNKMVQAFASWAKNYGDVINVFDKLWDREPNTKADQALQERIRMLEDLQSRGVKTRVANYRAGGMAETEQVDAALTQARAELERIRGALVASQFPQAKTSTGGGGAADELDETAGAAEEAGTKIGAMKEKVIEITDELQIAKDAISGLDVNVREAIGSVYSFGRSLDETEDRQLAREAREKAAEALKERQEQMVTLGKRIEQMLAPPGGRPAWNFLNPGETPEAYLNRATQSGLGQNFNRSGGGIQPAPQPPAPQIPNPYDAVKFALGQGVTFVVDNLHYTPGSEQVRFFNQRKAVDGLL